MKKNIIYSLSLFLLLSLSACNQWLEVEPKTEIKSDKMFENETGFRDALIGCYMMMADSTLYGRESTVCFFDVLAQQYDMATNNPYNNLKQYRYESYTGTIDGIWQKTYRIIANLNALLEVSDEKKAILHPTTYGIIKGEAIGLRAFLHFELLRIFGWGNLENQPSNLDKLSIPYVTEYSKVLTKQSTVKEVLGYIHRDLAEAATAQQAGNIAGRVGAGVCCLVSVVFVWATGTMLYSPWVIYFSILGTHSLVTYRKKKRNTDLTLTILYFAMFLLFLVLFAVRLVGVRG